jgi:hypothetical protein
MVRQFLQQKLHLPAFDQASLDQLSMPVSRLGGFGLTSAFRLMDAAYVSSVCLAMPALSPLISKFPAAPIMKRLSRSLNILFDRGVPRGKHLPSTAEECVSSFGDLNAHQFKIQHWITQETHKHISAANISSMASVNVASAQRTEARLKSAGGPRASDWLVNLNAFSDRFGLNDQEFQDSFCLRLGVPLCDPSILCVRCGVPFSPEGDPFGHLCWCPCSAAKHAVIQRHNMVNQALYDVVVRAGLYAEREPNDKKEEEHLVPDGYIFGLKPGKKVCWDVAICHIGDASLSMAPVNSQVGLKAAAKKEKQKHQKYNEMMRRSGDEFVAFAIETHGAVGNEARLLLKRIANQVEAHKRKDFLEWAYSHLSCAVQKGNALLWRAGVYISAEQVR